jgi:hypothetical protein
LFRQTKIEWFAVALALTAGCPTTGDEQGDAAAYGGDADGGTGTVESDAGSSSKSDSGSSPWIIQRPDGGAPIDPGEAPTCGASSIEPEQVLVETQVEVPVEITEEITEEVTEEVTEEITEEVVTTKPATLYILFDRSASMSGATGNGDLWNPAVAAVKSFVNDGDSAGLGVGIQYFPKSGGSCNGNGYKTPAVTPGTLPGRASAIGSSLDATNPEALLGASGTPIEGALRGATQYCLDYQASHTGEQCVAVIVTDGKPEFDSCEKSTTNLANIAKAAKDKGVITFAVGLKGANFALLDEIAKKGGAPDCDTGSSRYSCDVSDNPDKLSVALAKIRQTTITTETHTVTYPVTKTITYPVTRTETRTEYVTEVQKTPLPCEWAIPKATEGQFDRDKLNVRWSVNEDRTTLLRVGSNADCRENAWYYDNPEQPERVIACSQTCEQIKAEEDSSVDLLLGCATIVPG